MQKLKTKQIRKNKCKEISFFSFKYIYIYIYIFEITFNVHFNFFIFSS